MRWTLNGKTYSLTVGKDSRDTIKAAKATAQTIDSDIIFNRFDSSLVKYGKQSTVLEVVSSIQPELGLGELWKKYVSDRLPNWKPMTIEKYKQFSELFERRLGSKLIYNGLEVKSSLLEITTRDRTRDCLEKLSACCDWGIKHKLIQENPFKGMAAEMPKPRYATDPNPNAFTELEREQVIEAFKNDNRPGMNYRHYASLVEFWFFTGCRPSKAIGLTWDKVNEDCSQIIFDCSIQTTSRGKKIKSEGSKNNKSRKIAVSNRIKGLLQSIKPESIKPNQLVFHSPDSPDMPINYRNFTRRAWSAIVDPIKEGTTPDNCRDTFITQQLLKGTASAVIAKWCDTFTAMIDRSYADKLKLNQLKPID